MSSFPRASARTVGEREAELVEFRRLTDQLRGSRLVAGGLVRARREEQDARILVVGLLEVVDGPVVRFREPPYLFRTDFVRLTHA